MSVKIVLLCEDQQLATFMRRFLKRRGWQAHDIREVISPSGRGSGEQWVRGHYPKELAAARARGGGTVLMVGTDADTLPVTGRIESLDQECRDQGVPVRSANDLVIMVVPKRNIETWFAYLREEDVNEADVYERYRHESDCQEDVKVLDAMCRHQHLRLPAPPSLQAACAEFARMPRRNS